MTRDQRLVDFQQLVALYAKQYAPYEWKRDTVGFDLLKIGPWLERVDKAKDDLEFLDICAQYVGSLQDGHSQFVVPSGFITANGLDIDIYDGKVLVDRINRQALPERDYPIAIGDEVVAIDGKPPEQVIRELAPFVASGNRRATDRFAIEFAVFRPQAILPRAHEVPARSRFLFRKRDGTQEAYDIPWQKAGDPVTVIGPVPDPYVREAARTEAEASETVDVPIRRGLFRGLPELTKAKVRSVRAIAGFGSLAPAFNPPAGFTQRLGRSGRDTIFSGTYTASGKRIGLIRIPEFYDGGFVANIALTQFVQEAVFMQTNTDGLIVDVMRNPGGDVCLTQDLISVLMPKTFKMPGMEIRATRDWISRYESLIADLRASGAPRWLTDILTAMLGDIKGAYKENRGRTGPLPICDISLDVEPARDARTGNLLVYTKPLMVLTDELSASAAELFAATIQDNDRGIVFGMPTLGAGGTVSGAQPTGWYSETGSTVTQSLVVRPREISSDGEYPVAPYIENIGVRPDIKADFMTRDNLLNNGKAFVDAFTAAMVERLNQ